MDVTITVPSSVEEHLRKYAASLFFETTPYAISRSIVHALINQLDAACIVSREEIVAEILGPVPAAAAPVVAPVAEDKLVTLLVDSPSAEDGVAEDGVAEDRVGENSVGEDSVGEDSVGEEAVVAAAAPAPVKKSSKTAASSTIADPEKLKVPAEKFQGNTSNTWLVWGWCMASGLTLATSAKGRGKSSGFAMPAVLQGVAQQKEVQVKEPTAYSALDVLTKRQWLDFDKKSKRYTLTPVAQKWVLQPQNQAYLSENGFAAPVEEAAAAE